MKTKILIFFILISFGTHLKAQEHQINLGLNAGVFESNIHSISPYTNAFNPGFFGGIDLQYKYKAFSLGIVYSYAESGFLNEFKFLENSTYDDIGFALNPRHRVSSPQIYVGISPFYSKDLFPTFKLGYSQSGLGWDPSEYVCFVDALGFNQIENDALESDAVSIHIGFDLSYKIHPKFDLKLFYQSSISVFEISYYDHFNWHGELANKFSFTQYSYYGISFVYHIFSIDPKKN